MPSKFRCVLIGISLSGPNTLHQVLPGSAVRAGIVDRIVSAKMLPEYIEGLVS